MSLEKDTLAPDHPAEARLNFHLFIYSFIHLFIYSFIHLFIYSFIHLLICSFAHLLICSFAHLLICSFAHLLICSLIIYLFIVRLPRSPSRDVPWRWVAGSPSLWLPGIWGRHMPGTVLYSVLYCTVLGRVLYCPL